MSVKAAAQNEANAAKNKTLFDQTVEKLNFRTIEFVYDRKFPRKKFPVSQTDFKTRKTFDDFEGNAAFKKLFMNYNDVSEKFKSKFGKGKTDLASFEKGLADILINKDFEFFISSLNKDDKVQLIKSLQQINKKGIAQYLDASGKPRGFFSSDSVIEESADPIVKTNQPAIEKVAATADQAVINADATPEEVFQEKTPRRDWLTWLTLVVALAALATAASVKAKDVPSLRSFMANNYQRKGEVGIVTKPLTKTEESADPAIMKQLGNLTREVEGLYAQMDELLHKNTVLEQKLANKHPKPFDLPKTTYFEPQTETAETNSATTPTGTNSPVTFPAEPAAYDLTETAPIENVATDEFYLGKPDKLGFFWDHELTENQVPEQSLYKISFSGSDHRKGNFEVVTDASQQRLALENRDNYLKPVCEILEENPNGSRIETETPGTVILNDDQWVLVKKAKIRIV